MASFCGKCGSPLSANGAFCVNCGNPAGLPPVQPPPNYAAAPKSSSALKIILIIFCCLLVAGAAAVGGLFYLAHRVKQAVVAKAAENGVDLNSITSSLPQRNAAAARLPKPCDALSKEQMSQMIGEPVERTEIRDMACLYFGPAGLSAKLAQDQASDTYHRAQTGGSATDGMAVANSVDQLVNSLGATRQDGSHDEQPLLMLLISADGRSQMTALSTTRAIFGNLGRSAESKGIGMGSEIPGLGDKALRMPKLGLNVLKGETLVRVIPGPIPDPDSKTVAIARAVLPKI